MAETQSYFCTKWFSQFGFKMRIPWDAAKAEMVVVSVLGSHKLLTPLDGQLPHSGTFSFLECTSVQKGAAVMNSCHAMPSLPSELPS